VRLSFLFVDVAQLAKRKLDFVLTLHVSGPGFRLH